ncbi:MAG: hypothetical protein SFX72_07860 [Isosphaeraceae bacterium]|nr:hypothetical protein [Isosphaeraceae bacterium]
MLETLILGLVALQEPVIDPALETRWRAEYPTAAESLRADLEQFSLRGRRVFRFFDGNVLTTEDFVVAASSGRRLLIHRDQTVQSPKTKSTRPAKSTVRVRTPEIWFDLERPAGSEQFLINDHARGRPENDILFESDFERYSLWSISMGDGTLLEHMSSPDFDLRSIRSHRVGDLDLVRVEYRLSTKDHLSDCDVDLDPERGWLKVRWGYSSRAKDEPADAFQPYTQFEAEYDEFAPGHFLPKRMVSHTAMKDPKNFRHIVVEYREAVPGPPPEAIFSLQGYGLPDLPLEPVSAKPFFSFANPILWGCLAVALVATALLKFGRFHRSDRQATT